MFSKILIANRYTQSNMAFQGAKFEGEEMVEFANWIKQMESRLPQPDLVIFLDMPVEQTEMMIGGREDKEYIKGKKKDIHEEDIEFQKKVRRTYLELARLENWKVIRCTKDGIVRHPNDIHHEIWESVKELIRA